MTPEIDELCKQYESGMLSSRELSAIAACLISFPWKDEIVVEIGTYQGQSTVWLAKILATAGYKPTILSIDGFTRCEAESDLNAQGDHEARIKNIMSENLEHQCLAISGLSADAVRFVPYRIGVLIVDGCHHYEECSQDLWNYTVRVVDGGYVVIDDYLPKYYPGVVKAVDEFIAGSNSSRFSVIHKSTFVILEAKEKRV